MNIQFLQKELGRIPNEIELLFFHYFWKSYKLQSMFDSEASQAEVQSNDSSKMILVAQGQSDPRNRISDNSIHALNAKKLATISRGKGSFTLGILPDRSSIQPKTGQHAYFISGGNLRGAIQALNTQDWFESAIPVNKGGLGYSLYQMFMNYECGLIMAIEKSENINILSRKGVNGLIIVMNKGEQEYFCDLMKEKKCNYMELGRLRKEFNIDLYHKNKVVGHIPISILTRLVNQNPNRSEIKIQTSIPSALESKLKEKNRFNDALIRLMKKNNKTETLQPIQKKIIKRANIAFIKNYSRLYGLAVNDNDTKYYTDYKMKSIAAIANSTRHLACAGIRPEVCSGFVAVSNGNLEEKGSYLSGIQSAGKHLNINVQHVSFEQTDNPMDGEFCSGGTGIGNALFPDDFPCANLFISMIGSHRGELGGSQYLSLINQETTGTQPVVDLLMESRLQETILTGIQGRLIQSARAVGAGGIAVSIAKSFGKNTKLGARIHFSRKLKIDELLFGETQGLVIVTIKETDLMEFERVCMTIGIPATTIGRITDDGVYSFNEAIKLPVSKLV
jgi:phosphoribosylformylglycinamidine (FGAM) synthase-like enzyme